MGDRWGRVDGIAGNGIGRRGMGGIRTGLAYLAHTTLSYSYDKPRGGPSNQWWFGTMG